MAGSGTAQLRSREDTLLQVRHLSVEYPASGGRRVHAVSDVSFDIRKGETLGLVGESGCGKSTTGLAIMRLTRASAGEIDFDGLNILDLPRERLRQLRPSFQLIFQDPSSALNPRRTVGSAIMEPLRLWTRDDRASWSTRVNDTLESVGLDPRIVADRRPHEFSGGQLQRICIARALILRPKLLVADEPVSALDVSVQAQILNLLHDMKEQYDLTMMIVAHDLAVVKNISDRVAVMYLGKLCEVGGVDWVYRSPAHPYTAALLESVPRIRTKGATAEAPLSGEIPSPVDPPPGCRFATRCPRATEICRTEEPVMRAIRPIDQFVACHHPLIGEATLRESNRTAMVNG